ncbi:MAG: hypothetical protein IJS46_00050, partial [Kiritimatiellae bacterium]|nr:hypothetical protein [Kiritimatiellia bacterium]
APAGIRPISIKPVMPGATAPLKPVDASSASPTIRMTQVPTAAAAPAAAPAAAAPAAPKGIRPISIKPPVPISAPDSTAQAIKGKTSRISLDAALAGMPASPGATAAMGRMTTNLAATAEAAKAQTAAISAAALAVGTGEQQQTIRISRPSIATGAAKAAAPAASEAPTLKRKPLTIKKPGAEGDGGKPAIKTADAAPDGASSAKETPMGSDIEAPPSAFGGNSMLPVQGEKVGVLFPVIAVAAVIALMALTFVNFLAYQF